MDLTHINQPPNPQSIVESSPSSKKRKADDSLDHGNSSLNIADSEALVHSSDPLHPANHICSLCRKFYDFGWVTGTGGGVSIRDDKHIFIAPSGVQKELMQPTDIFVMDAESKQYLRRPPVRYHIILPILFVGHLSFPS